MNDINTCEFNYYVFVNNEFIAAFYLFGDCQVAVEALYGYRATPVEIYCRHTEHIDAVYQNGLWSFH